MKTAHRLLLATDILLLILIPLFVVFANEKLSKMEEGNASSNEVLGTSDVELEEVVKKSVSVCIENDCLEVKNEYEDMNKLNMYVVEDIVPFLDELAGGKTYTINKNGKFLHWKNDLIPDTKGLTEQIYKALKYDLERVDVALVESPSTDGTYAERYIEIDNSRQKLYAWNEGVVVKEIDLSGAKNNYVVYGVFNIVDKGPNPIAPSGRYMPYWMAFYYSKPQEAWYGLHGLVWWYDENGRAIFEPETNIGVRRSNGCIRMIKEDAKFLYDMYERRDPILIHE